MAFNKKYVQGGHSILFIAGPDLGGEYAGVIEHGGYPGQNGWGLVGITWDKYGREKHSLVDTKNAYDLIEE